jgi:hypothetical protein
VTSNVEEDRIINTSLGSEIIIKESLYTQYVELGGVSRLRFCEYSR